MEEWKDAIGFEGLYRVSSFGRIESQDRISPTTGRKLYGKIIKQSKHSKGYKRISIRDKNFNRCFDFTHRVVAKAFIPNLENKSEVNHIDGDKTNNKVSNLEWVTHGENMAHAGEMDLMKKGDNHYFSKLSIEDVKYIKSNYIPRDKELNSYSLARKFNVSQTVIMDIINNKSWKHIEI